MPSSIVSGSEKLGVQTGINFKELAARPVKDLLARENPGLRQEYGNLVTSRERLASTPATDATGTAFLESMKELCQSRIISIEAMLSYRDIPPTAVAEISLGISKIGENGQLVRDSSALTRAAGELINLGLINGGNGVEQQVAQKLLDSGKTMIETNIGLGISFSQVLNEAEAKASPPQKEN